MLNRPKFKDYFNLEIVESVGVFLISESDRCLLTGRLYEYLAPLINGDRTVEEIVRLLQDRASTAEIYYALMLMEQKGYIVESNHNLSPKIAAFCEFLNVAPEKAQERLETIAVSVQSLGNVDRQQFIDLLNSLQIQTVAEGEIEIVLVDDYLQVDLDTINQKALQLQRPWILVKPIGKIIWIGPIFNPGKTGCWECLAQRLRANRPVEKFLQKQKNISTFLTTSIAALPSTIQMGINLAANEIFKWIVSGHNQRLEGNLITFDTVSLQIQDHALTKRPQCHVCGDSEYQNRKPAPVLLESRQKSYTADGGHRSFTPEQTLKRYGHHISPITGAVRGLSLIAQSNHKLTPNYIAGHNFASMFDSLYFLRENLRGRSAGKGKTDTQAKASAFGEAIERYSGVFQGDEIRIKGKYEQMEDVAIHPNACMLFSKDQYNTRQDWNRSCSSFFQKVPEPFDEEREIEWTPIWSLTNQEFKYLPTAYCYYGYPKPDRPDCWADSNGTAAGNTKEEAILQGFMELVERDSVAVWWYNRFQRSAVDLDSFDQPYWRSLQEYYRTLDREIWVLDLSNDLNIPVFAALSKKCDREVEDIIYGFGAHFDPTLAITRALTEMNQVLPTVINVDFDGATQYSVSDDKLALAWWQTATLANQPYLVPDKNTLLKTRADYPQLASDDLLEDIQTCINIASQHGMETLVLDQTRPDIGLNVVKVIVPGMRHFWKRWGTGRLYDVPVRLGKLQKPLQENQLNPIPIFF